jgi:hypothetical protein
MEAFLNTICKMFGGFSQPSTSMVASPSKQAASATPRFILTHGRQLSYLQVGGELRHAAKPARELSHLAFYSILCRSALNAFV